MPRVAGTQWASDRMARIACRASPQTRLHPPCASKVAWPWAMSMSATACWVRSMTFRLRGCLPGGGGNRPETVSLSSFLWGSRVEVHPMGEAALRCRFFFALVVASVALWLRTRCRVGPGRKASPATHAVPLKGADDTPAQLPFCPSVRPGLVAPALVLRTPIRRARDHHHASPQAAYLRAEPPPGTG